MKKTSYLLGDCDSKIARVNTEENSFRPSFQHVFNEKFPKNYLKVETVVEGEVVYRFFDMSNRRFLRPEEVNDKLKGADAVIE